VQPPQNLGCDRLQPGNDEREMESAVQITRVVQLPGQQGVIQVRESQPCRFGVGRQRAPSALRHRARLDLQPQSEHLVDFHGGKGAHLKTTVGEDIHQPLGPQLHECFAHRNFADAELSCYHVLQER
jgi:hypothetical protein